MIRFGKWLLICALVGSIGGQWAVLQVVAWTGMTLSYSKQESFSAALSKTFDGKHPCKLCKMVRAGKKAQNDSEAKLDTKKLDSIATPFFVFTFPPQRKRLIAQALIPQSFLAAPLSPPPKFA
ncbi:MAG: hypothetical protein ABIV39_15965 [Verrucomicrobiota bacterium]